MSNVTKVRKPSPSAIVFATACNDPGVNTRLEALAKLEELGFPMNYSAFAARYKSYTDPDRKGGPIKIKDLSSGQRGRHIDADEINKALEAQAQAQAEKAAADAIRAAESEAPAPVDEQPAV